MNIDATRRHQADEHRVDEPPAVGVSVNSSLKFARLALFGISSDELSVPTGLSAADTTKRIGNNEKASASSPTR